MGTVHRFRRLRQGDPRKLSTPDFLHERPADRLRPRRLLRSQVTGWLLIAVAVAGALTLIGAW